MFHRPDQTGTGAGQTDPQPEYGPVDAPPVPNDRPPVGSGEEIGPHSRDIGRSSAQDIGLLLTVHPLLGEHSPDQEGHQRHERGPPLQDQAGDGAFCVPGHEYLHQQHLQHPATAAPSIRRNGQRLLIPQRQSIVGVDILTQQQFLRQPRRPLWSALLAVHPPEHHPRSGVLQQYLRSAAWVYQWGETDPVGHEESLGIVVPEEGVGNPPLETTQYQEGNTGADHSQETRQSLPDATGVQYPPRE